MIWEFFESLAFYAVLSKMDTSKWIKKEERLIKTEAFYHECYKEITNESKRACDLIGSVTQKAASVYFPSEILEGIRLLPLFCFGEVLRKQGHATKEQKRVMGFYFDYLNFQFSQPEYTSAMICGRKLRGFSELMELTHDNSGAFWVNMFRAFCKAGTQDEFQEIVDSITGTIMRFSLLGNPKSKLSIEICEKFVANLNHQIQHVMDVPVTGIDWLGIVPIEDRKREMRKIYYSLISDSDITSEVDESGLKELLEVLYLHTICDIVMMTKCSNSEKLSMISEGLQFAGVVPIISPEKYLKDIANNTDIGAAYAQFFICRAKECGQFWGILLVMGKKQVELMIQLRFCMI